MKIYKKIRRHVSMRTSSKFNSPSEITNWVVRNGVQVLSVDLFDTLVFRSVANPSDVFLLQYQRFEDDIKKIIPSMEFWRDVRQAAERELASKKFPLEITIYDIYKKISTDLLFDDHFSSRLLQHELSVESDVIFPYCEFVDVLRHLSNNGLHIKVTTDIYLPVKFLRSLLDKFLDFDFEIFCSSELGDTKRGGGLFRCLKSKNLGLKIGHIGDNPRADVAMGSEEGLCVALVEWARSDFMVRNQSSISILKDLGINRISTPFDNFSLADSTDVDFKELGWRWSVVLLDYLLGLHEYVDKHRPDEIWFLSRDCEIIYNAVLESGFDFCGAKLKYIYASRAVAYPLVALEAEDLYKKWTSSTPNMSIKDRGLINKEALLDRLDCETKRIVIVDVGWKGRVQRAIQYSMPDVDVHGWYFSLEPTAEEESKSRSGCYVSWNRNYINQAGIESMSGFNTPSCLGYSKSVNGDFSPVLKDEVSDCAPESFRSSLLFFLVRNLISIKNGRRHSSREVVRINNLLTNLGFPDFVFAKCFAHWSIGAEISAPAGKPLVAGGDASLLQKILGREVNGNYWPNLAFWGIFHHSFLVRFFQFCNNFRRSTFSR